MLVDEGVAVVAHDAKAQPDKKVQATRKVMPKRFERDEDEDEQARTNDPVRMYLRKMGSVSLLTREGEVEIAKRIEEGERRMLEVALQSPVAIPYIFEMYDRIKRSQLRIKDVIQINNPADNGPAPAALLAAEPGPVNQEAAFENLQKQLEKIRRHQKEVEKLREQMQPLGPDKKPLDPKKHKLFAQV